MLRGAREDARRDPRRRPGLGAGGYLTALPALTRVQRDAAQPGSGVDEGVQGGLQPGQLPGGSVELVDGTGSRWLPRLRPSAAERAKGGTVAALGVVSGH